MVVQRDILNDLADLFAKEMGLQDRVFLYNQRWNIPKEEGLFMEIALVGTKPYGANTRRYSRDRVEGSVTYQELVEEISVPYLSTVTLTLFSKDESARHRQIEVVQVLNSTPAQQMMELKQCRFSTLPMSFVDVSETEGSGRLNKYAYTFTLFQSQSRERIVEFWNKFENPPKTLLVNP